MTMIWKMHFIFHLFFIVASVNAKPEKLWEIQSYSNSTSRERILRSPHIPSSRPQKIRLVNYEQRQLAAQRQQIEATPKNTSYLEMVRQKMRGVPTQAVEQVIPVLPQEIKADHSRLPELDTYHKARQLFEARGDESTLAPLSELEIKADYQLQKSMQRTTMRTKIYPTEAIDNETNDSDPTHFATTTQLPSPVSSIAPMSNFLQPTVMPQFSPFQPFPTFPNLTQPSFINPLEIPSFPQSSQSSSMPGFPPRTSNNNNNNNNNQNFTKPQFEQLGCGFDLLTNTCKDVFNIGWCNSCEDFGNIFLHDCKCTLPSQRYQQFNSTLAPDVPNLPMQPQQINLQQQQQLLIPPQLSLQSQQQPQQQIQTPETNIQNRSHGLQNFFVQPRFFGFY